MWIYGDIKMARRSVFPICSYYLIKRRFGGAKQVQVDQRIEAKIFYLHDLTKIRVSYMNGH
jgi:hypothetical protein